MDGSERKKCALLSSSENARADRIRKLNDELRENGHGGRIVITKGVEQLELPAIATILTKVRNFSEFDRDNDPFCEHDMGGFASDGRLILWKIDYYDSRLEFASPDPTDPVVTKRVLTVMLASEY